MNSFTFHTVLSSLAIAVIATTACQPTQPTQTLSVPIPAVSIPVSTPSPIKSPELPLLAFGWHIGETIPYTEVLTTVTTDKAPKPWEPGASYTLVYYKGKLLKVIARSALITNDIYGHRGQKEHRDLSASLAERYGKPVSDIQVIGLKVYKESDEFYNCLKYKGCGGYIAIFETPTKGIILQLEGTRRGEGYNEMTVESKEWSTALAEFSAAKNKTLTNNL